MLADPATARERLFVETTRVRDRLRTLNLTRLEAIGSLVHEVAQSIVDLDMRLEGRPMRTLPRLGDETVEAQLGVAVNDLLAAAGTSDEEVLTQAADSVTELRRSLP